VGKHSRFSRKILREVGGYCRVDEYKFWCWSEWTGIYLYIIFIFFFEIFLFFTLKFFFFFFFFFSPF
jgi:hypothetical protein